MRTGRFLKVALGATFLAFLCSLYAGLHEIAIGPGDMAPAFALTADSGQHVSPSDFAGKALLLNFWASWCEPCQAELPSLNTLAQSFVPRGLVILAVSQDTDEAAYRQFASRMPLILSLRQPGKTIQLTYGTTHIPESYLIDRSGRIKAKFVSNQNWLSPEIVAQIQALL